MLILRRLTRKHTFKDVTNPTECNKILEFNGTTLMLKGSVMCAKFWMILVWSLNEGFTPQQIKPPLFANCSPTPNPTVRTTAQHYVTSHSMSLYLESTEVVFYSGEWSNTVILHKCNYLAIKSNLQFFKNRAALDTDC